MQVQSLGREDPLEEEMARHSSILAWRITWTEEPGIQSTGSQRVGLTKQASKVPANTELANSEPLLLGEIVFGFFEPLVTFSSVSPCVFLFEDTFCNIYC